MDSNPRFTYMNVIESVKLTPDAACITAMDKLWESVHAQSLCCFEGSREQ